MNGALVSSFERWRDHIIEEKQMKKKALKVVQRMLNGALVWSFERWRDNIIEEKQLKSKALKVELNPWHRTNQTSSTSPCSVCYIHMYLYVCMYACMYVCMHVCMFVYMCVYVYIYVCILCRGRVTCCRR